MEALLIAAALAALWLSSFVWLAMLHGWREDRRVRRRVRRAWRMAGREPPAYIRSKYRLK